MVDIKTARWTPVDTYTYPERLMKIKQQAFHGVSSSCAMLYVSSSQWSIFDRMDTI